MTERLTDAELDAIGKDANWDSLYGERAIEELRALRAKEYAMDFSLDDFFAQAEEIKALREQNAWWVVGMAEFRQELRSALFPFWPNNMGVGGDEIVDAVRRAVEQNAKLVADNRRLVLEYNGRIEAARALDDQNAALVAALTAVDKRHYHPGVDCDACDQVHAALASVRGAE